MKKTFLKRLSFHLRHEPIKTKGGDRSEIIADVLVIFNWVLSLVLKLTAVMLTSVTSTLHQSEM